MPVYEKAEDLFANEKLDGVIIAASNVAHKPLTIMAAQNGVNIICEKPAALTVADFDEMMEAVNKAGVSFTVHQQRRFDKDFNTAKRCYDEKLVGDVYTIQSSLYGFNGNMHDWHIYKAEGEMYLGYIQKHRSSEWCKQLGEERLSSLLFLCGRQSIPV